MLILNMQEGWTALHWAAMKGHVAIVDLLVQNKADLNICDEVIFLNISAHKILPSTER